MFLHELALLATQAYLLLLAPPLLNPCITHTILTSSLSFKNIHTISAKGSLSLLQLFLSCSFPDLFRGTAFSHSDTTCPAPYLLSFFFQCTLVLCLPSTLYLWSDFFFYTRHFMSSELEYKFQKTKDIITCFIVLS